ncbi:Crp/Fnr family transcriptional regulator [Methylobacterium sp. ID0610]|uniref:Crp/Fnr family transcriptional regulator n=1 Tax=Methylobacterium carpenticola TaxID=3344827 RepID=UPI0036983153
MPDVFVRKLGHISELMDDDIARLSELTSCTQIIKPHTVLIQEGESCRSAQILLSGFACCYKRLHDRGRQIVAYRVPGDAEGLHGGPARVADYSLVTVTPCIGATIDRETIDDLIEHHPRIARSFWQSVLDERRLLCEWLMNVGQRPAPQRVAYLIHELFERLETVDLTRGSSVELPLTQQDLADTAGLSHVHVNRVLHSLKHSRMIDFNGRTIIIHDAARLKRFADSCASFPSRPAA